MSLTRIADLEEDNERLRDQLAELERDLDDRDATINELRAQINAKEENSHEHVQIESRDGFVWQRTVVLIEMPWEKTHEVAT